MHLKFDFPPNLNAEKFISKLEGKAIIELVSKQYMLKTFYDSFDWRLFKSDIACEFTRSKTTSTFALKNLKTNILITSTELTEVPAFSYQFESEAVKNILTPALKIRALLPVCNLDYENFHLNILNKDNKTVLRLVIEQQELVSSKLTIIPIKGYTKANEQFISLIKSEFNLAPILQPPIVIALKLLGRKPNDYSSKLNILLDPYMRADIAVKLIYSYLLKAIKDNEQGTIANTDSEFLHDFRVAVRRTRAGISQLKGLLPDNTNTYFAEFFSWLGQITSNTRDLDVYLLNFESYKNSLPESIRSDLDSLYDFLLVKQKQSQQELAINLRSSAYLTKISEWESFLKEQAPSVVIQANAKLSIYQLANQRILKSYRRVLKQGNEINDDSHAESLHTLRKSCKKLRYLLEFFQSFYPENQIKVFIKNLKELQEVLGDFQDYAVQENALKIFSVEMLNNNTNTNTLFAIEYLIQNLTKMRNEARNNFSVKFHEFNNKDNQEEFEKLLSRKII